MALDVIVSNRLKNSSYRQFSAWHDIMRGSISSNVVIIGSSRAWVHYSPAIIDSVLQCNSYNLGIDGSCLNRELTKYKLYRLYNEKPNLIILNIDYFSFGYTFGYESYQYFPYFFDPNVRKIIFPQEKFTFAEKFFPYYRYFKLGLNNIDQDYTTLYKGYHGQEIPWNGTRLKQIEAYDVFFDERTINSFEEFIKKTKEESIDIVMVFSPIYYEAKALLNNITQFDAFLSTIEQTYGIALLRYDNDPICMDTAYFYNALHLNKLGSEIFSRQLATDIQEMLP